MVATLGEAVASLVGRARDDAWSRDRARSQDRWTRQIVVVGAGAAVFASLTVARHVPRLRAYANNWWTFGLAIAVALGGIVLRDWAIISLGRYFRREVTIEPGQRIVRRGPYRLLRHPSYAGLLLIFGGLGLAFGSWVSAAIALFVSFLGLLPRIRVEEAALTRAFGAEYADYARSTARLVPHVW